FALADTAAQAVLALPECEPAALAEAHYALSLLHFETAAYPAGLASAAETIRLGQALGHPELESLGENQLGRLYLKLSRWDEAQAALLRALALAESHDLFELLLSVKQNLGLIELRHGHAPAARAQFLAALAGLEEADFRRHQAGLNLNIGTTYVYENKLAEGRRYYQRAYELYQQSGDKSRLGIGTVALAVIADAEGRWREVRRHRAAALRLFRESGLSRRVTEALNEYAYVELVLGNYRLAKQLIEESLALNEQLATPAGRLIPLAYLLWIAAEVGQLALASEQLEPLQTLLDEADLEPFEIASAHFARRRYWEAVGEYNRAEADVTAIVDLCREKMPRGLAQSLVQLGHLKAGQGRWDAATAAYQEALADLEGLGFEHRAIEPALGLARAELAAGQPGAAMAGVERLLRFLDRAEAPNSLHSCQAPALLYLWCYEILQANGDGRALAVSQEAYEFLRGRAAYLLPEWRESYWQAVPLHGQIRALIG
ncbi:MAG: hypothetical protein KDE04_23555, partial [Anaerolineales bacterium]|nr:hypothetical protein [Anaerolineales bacterium]